jgi:hypothetical protein
VIYLSIENLLTMRLEPLLLSKVDTKLRDVLFGASGFESLRVLFKLRVERTITTITPAPHSFASREAYRKALVDQRELQIAASTADTRNQLQALGIRILGGTLSPALIADGTAQQIGQALVLPEIESASLDRSVDLVHPVFHAAVTATEDKQ